MTKRRIEFYEEDLESLEPEVRARILEIADLQERALAPHAPHVDPLDFKVVKSGEDERALAESQRTGQTNPGINLGTVDLGPGFQRK